MMNKKYKLQKTNFVDIVIITLLSLWALLIFYPFYNSMLVSIVPQEVYLKTPFMLYPSKIDLTSIKFVLSSKAIIGGFKITTIIFVVGVLYNMFLTVSMGYVLTKDIWGRKLFTYIVIFTMYFGGGLIPFYILMKQLGLINTVASMILPTGINISYMIVIMKFFEELPKELEESAKIDGANDILILFKIILPISLPIIATFSLYYGVERWNEWWFAVLFVKKSALLPLQAVLRNIIQDARSVSQNMPQNGSVQTVFSDGVKMASVMVTMIPIMCLYPFLQKYFIAGLTAGAVKS